jgi:hypothetical protein
LGSYILNRTHYFRSGVQASVCSGCQAVDG